MCPGTQLDGAVDLPHQVLGEFRVAADAIGDRAQGGAILRTARKHEILVENDLPEAAATTRFDGIADRQTLRSALVQLTPDQREILLMHHEMGLNFREIAGVLGILRSTAKLRAHRAIKDLRKILGVADVTNQRWDQNK